MPCTSSHKNRSLANLTHLSLSFLEPQHLTKLLQMPPPSSPAPPSPSSRPGTPADNNNAIPDSASHEPDLPLTMASSVILSALPRDATTALSTAAEFPKPKVTVHFKAVGSAPELKRKLCQISSTQRFEVVVAYLRRTLKVGDMDSVFLYINSSFAPALDEVVGNLHRVRFCEGCLWPGNANVQYSASRILRTSLSSHIR